MPIKNRRRRFLLQIMPFAIFWLAFSVVYSLLEYGLLGSLDHYPSTGNQYNFGDNFLFTSLSSMIVGFLHGWVEVKWLRHKFKHRPLWFKIVFKTLFYLAFIILFLTVFSVINSLVNYREGVVSLALVDLKRFFWNFAFWGLIIYIAMVLFIALFFSEISQYVGDGVLYNFILGKYHRPRKEIRIFMFLDMKSSTTIAEEIGHENYFNLLDTYYSDMTDAILDTSGDIYQYVGDEIVVSWPEEKGVQNNNCLYCFEKIAIRIEQNKMRYLNRFGLVPEFKAGYHIGEVTTGEIGILKKDIIYTGDILNTAARIQAECNSHKAKVLISGELVDELKNDQGIKYNRIGKLLLRGKKKAIQLYEVIFD